MIKTTIVGFGDSLTFGYGVDFHVGFMDRLEKYMPQYFPSISWNIINSGLNGDTSRGALVRLKKDVLVHNPNIVLVLFGSNDCSAENCADITQSVFEKNMSEIIRRIKGHNNRTGLNDCIPVPLLITPPPVDDRLCGGYVTNNRLRQYSYVVKCLAKKYHCPLADAYSYFWEESGEDIVSCLQEDGVHLSQKGYDLLYDCIFSGITRLVNYEGILKDYDILE